MRLRGTGAGCTPYGGVRERAELEYAPLYAKYGMGTTIFSALAGGILTGKYNDKIDANTRFDNHKDFFENTIKELKSEGLVLLT